MGGNYPNWTCKDKKKIDNNAQKRGKAAAGRKERTDAVHPSFPRGFRELGSAFHEALCLHHAFAVELDEVGAGGQLVHVDVERGAAGLLVAHHGAGDAVDLVAVDTGAALHADVVGGGVGIDRQADAAAVVGHAVVGPMKGDVVNVEHELVSAVEVDDGDIDVLALELSQVDAEVVPCALRLGGHVGFPHHDEVVGVGVAGGGDGHAEVLGGVQVVLGAGDEGDFLAVELIGADEVVVGEQHALGGLVIGGRGDAVGVLRVAPVLAHLPAEAVLVGVDGGPAHDAVVEVVEEVAFRDDGLDGGVVAQGVDADQVGALVDVAEEVGGTFTFADVGAANFVS